MTTSWKSFVAALIATMVLSLPLNSAFAQTMFDAPPQPSDLAQAKHSVASADPTADEEAESDEESLAIGVNFNTSPHLEDVFLGKVDPNLDDLRQLQFRVNDLVQQLRPAVVGIRMRDGQGSGVIVTSDGYILTAAHVVGQRGLKAQVVMPDGSTHDAVVLGTDASSDSGMLRLLDKGPWPYVSIGESGSLQEGQWVLALGHPGGFDPDRDSVVRVGRMLTKPGRTTLQTDCTLVGGDSGGPLFDLDGFVIGIHSRISRRIQQNYHVSVDIFTTAWDEMSEDAKVSFGFSLKKQSETDKLIVRAVDGPVARAGMQVGDELLKINGVEVKTRDEIRATFDDIQVFETIEVVVRRKVKASAKSESSESETQDSDEESDESAEGSEGSEDQSEEKQDDEDQSEDNIEDSQDTETEADEKDTDPKSEPWKEITLKVTVGAR